MTSAGRLGSLIDALRSAISTGIDLVHTRARLLSVELEQETLRALSLIIHAIAALLLACAAAGFIGIALIVVFWDTHRELVAMLVAAFFALSAAVAAWFLKRTLATRRRPFQSTLEALDGERVGLVARSHAQRQHLVECGHAARDALHQLRLLLIVARGAMYFQRLWNRFRN
jgi:uncharacterized membrane protein YqjE